VAIVYVLFEPSTRKVRYVGSTINLDDRLRLHWSSRFCRTTNVAIWLRSLDEMPESYVLQEVSDEYQYDAEEYWSSLLRQIDTVDLLNVRDGHSQKNEPRRRMTAETKKKIADSVRGYHHSEIARAKISVAAVQRAQALTKKKLSSDDVREIRQSNLSDRELAHVYDVAQSTIHRARYKITWKHISLRVHSSVW
jgi:DNA-binding transcriptional regulator YiaG